jgi:SAM-dependent methyltransferase
VAAPSRAPASQFDSRVEDFSQVAHQRLYPSLTDPNYLVLRARRLIFAQWIRQLPGDRLRILDVGGRYQPYRSLLQDRTERYIALDLARTQFVSVIGDGQALPFASQSFDLVIATQAFDYMRDPTLCVREILSVLKPGGVLLASLPAFAPRFADGERWRFTAPGLRTLFEAFPTLEIVPELHDPASLVRTINLAADGFIHYGPLRAIYRRTCCPMLNALGRALEGMHLTANDQFAANYSVRAQKA